jgi:hypothetical protein
MKKKFAVDVHWDFAKSFVVEAESREEAEEIINGRIDRREIDPIRDDFEKTEDTEVSVSGEEDESGEIAYY